MSRVLLFFCLGCVVLSSCVQNKKILYLQTEDELEKDFPTDTVLRTYDLTSYEYRIQPEDVLSVRVSSLTDEEYDLFAEENQGNNAGNAANQALNGYLVNPEGKIVFPIAGHIEVEGLTISEAEETIKATILPFAASPSVRVRLLNYRVTVLGEVNQEGVVELVNNRASVLEVIGWAGGLTDLAKRDQVKLIRAEKQGAKVIYLDLLEEDFLNSENFYVKSGDVIIVEPLKQRPFRKYFGPNLSLIISSVSLLLLTLNFIK